jgi:outer membrane scaffolding protein for murein synthesis (MipA/OmpV family)
MNLPKNISIKVVRSMKTAITTFLFVLVVSIVLASLENVVDTPEKALVPLPSVFDFTRGRGWGVAVGVGVEYETAYDGSDEYEFEIDPAGAVQWRRNNHLLFWEGIEAGVRSRLKEKWLTQLGLRYEGGREADDSEDGRLNGLKDQDSHIVGVVEVRRSVFLNYGLIKFFLASPKW